MEKLYCKAAAFFLQVSGLYSHRKASVSAKGRTETGKGSLVVIGSVRTLLEASPSVEDLELCWCHHQSATATNTLREDCDFLGSDSVKRLCSQQESMNFSASGSATVRAAGFCLD